METDDNPQRHPRNRRVCPSELKQTIKALKRALRKENKRADKMLSLRKEIEELAGQLSALRRS